MSLTVKVLKDSLKNFRDDAIVRDIQLQDFIHLISDSDGNLLLSKHRPIGLCVRSGEYVYPSEVDGYSAYCPELDEDLFNIEWIKIDHENGER